MIRVFICLEEFKNLLNGDAGQVSILPQALWVENNVFN